MEKSNVMIEIINGFYVNVNMLKKIVRDNFGRYFVILTNKEKYPISTDVAYSLKKLGLINA